MGGWDAPAEWIDRARAINAQAAEPLPEETQGLPGGEKASRPSGRSPAPVEQRQRLWQLPPLSPQGRLDLEHPRPLGAEI